MSFFYRNKAGFFREKKRILRVFSTWDGGGAHANSRWNEELVRTERESERERVLYSRTVWHGERDTESLARYFYLKNRSHWEVPVFEGKPSTSWRDPIIPILL